MRLPLACVRSVACSCLRPPGLEYYNRDCFQEQLIAQHFRAEVLDKRCMSPQSFARGKICELRVRRWVVELPSYEMQRTRIRKQAP